jgi:serine/threonine-protein kinase
MSVDPRDPRPGDEPVVRPGDETVVERRAPVEETAIVRRRRPGPPVLWPWLLLLLLGVLVALGAVWYFTTRDTTKTVPDVVGNTLETAVSRLEEEGFKTDIARANSERPAGEVYEQSPGGGTEADEGSTVRIGVSQGPATAAVPSVVGATEADARSQLTEAGFEVNRVQVFSDQPEGTVVAQNPTSGEARKGSSVRINVSKGSGEVTVPDVVGQTEEAAKAQLAQLNLKANVDNVPSSEPEGTVVAQNPGAGSTARADSLVRLNVSDGSG